MRASIVWLDMIANQMTPEEVAVSKDLPLAAVYEAIAYCEANQDLIRQDAENECRYLEEQGNHLTDDAQTKESRIEWLDRLERHRQTVAKNTSLADSMVLQARQEERY